MDEHYEQNDVSVTHVEHDSTGQQLADALAPLMGDLTDCKGLVVVALSEDGDYRIFGPHKVIEAGIILSGALGQMSRTLRQEDVIDFMTDMVEIPDDASEIDGIL